MNMQMSNQPGDEITVHLTDNEPIKLAEELAPFFMFKVPVILKEADKNCPVKAINFDSNYVEIVFEKEMLKADVITSLTAVKLYEIDPYLAVSCFANDTDPGLINAYEYVIEPLRFSWMTQLARQYIPQKHYLDLIFILEIHLSCLLNLGKHNEVELRNISKDSENQIRNLEQNIIIYSAALYNHYNGELPRELTQWFILNPEINQRFMIYEPYLTKEPSVEYYYEVAREHGIDVVTTCKDNMKIIHLKANKNISDRSFLLNDWQ